MRTKHTQLRLVKPRAWRVHPPQSGSPPPNSPSRAGGMGSRGLACKALNKLESLFLDARVLADEQLNERTQQRFASLSHVVNELEAPEVERGFGLGNAPMWAQPTAQQRPEPSHGIDMHCM